MDLKLKNSTCSCGCLSRLSELCGEFKQSHHRLESWIMIAAISSVISITLILFLIISNLSGCYRNLKPEKIEETEYGSCLIDDEFIQETNSRAYIVNEQVVVILTETDKVDVFDMTAYYPTYSKHIGTYISTRDYHIICGDTKEVSYKIYSTIDTKFLDVLKDALVEF